MKKLITLLILITPLFLSHASDKETAKESLEGWDLFKICDPGRETFMAKKNDVHCFVCHDPKRGTYTWKRVQVDADKESYSVEETVESQEPLDIFTKMKNKFLQEQREKNDALLVPFPCMQQAKEQT